MDNAAFYTKEDLYQIAKKILAGTDFPAAVFTGINPIKRSWSALKRKIAGCIHRYDSVAQALDTVLEGNQLYIDETGLQTQMYRQYVRSKRGKRINIRICGKCNAQIGLVAALYEGTLFAPHTYSGTMKASVFEEELLNNGS